MTFYDLLKGDPATTTAPRIANLLQGFFYSGLSIQAFPNQASPTSLLKRLVAESVDSTRRPYSNISNQQGPSLQASLRGHQGDSLVTSPIKHVRLPEPAVYYNYDEATVGLYYYYFIDFIDYCNPIRADGENIGNHFDLHVCTAEEIREPRKRLDRV